MPLDFMNFVSSRFAVLIVRRRLSCGPRVAWPGHEVTDAAQRPSTALHACFQVDRLPVSRLVIRQNQIDADVRSVQLTTPADLRDIRLALLIH